MDNGTLYSPLSCKINYRNTGNKYAPTQRAAKSVACNYNSLLGESHQHEKTYTHTHISTQTLPFYFVRTMYPSGRIADLPILVTAIKIQLVTFVKMFVVAV